MRRQAWILSACLVVGVPPGTAGAAQTPAPRSQESRLTGSSPQAGARPGPYSRLFQPVSPLPGPRPTPVASRTPSPGRETVVKCGMKLIPADPGIDPGIALRPMPGATRFAIRAIEPTICR